MIFSKMKKPVSLMALASALITLLVFVNDSFASATWLSSITNVKSPTRVALDSQGNLFVTDTDDSAVKVYDRRGNYVTTLAGLKEPIGIAVSGSTVYIGNRGSRSVDVYTYTGGALTFSKMLGSGSGEFKAPEAIAVSKSGMIFVADRLDHQVKIYNANGSLAKSFG
jgi:WD40 repeat protein